MVMPPEHHQPGLGVRQERVLEVLVCQHKHLHPLAGAVLHPAQKMALDGTRNPDSASLYCGDTCACASSQDLQ